MLSSFSSIGAIYNFIHCFSCFMYFFLWNYNLLLPLSCFPQKTSLYSFSSLHLYLLNLPNSLNLLQVALWFIRSCIFWYARRPKMIGTVFCVKHLFINGWPCLWGSRRHGNGEGTGGGDNCAANTLWIMCIIIS